MKKNYNRNGDHHNNGDIDKKNRDKENDEENIKNYKNEENINYEEVIH